MARNVRIWRLLVTREVEPVGTREYVPTMPRTGRPRSDNPRTRMVNSRLTEEEYLALAQAAEEAGVTVSEYVRSQALSAARAGRHTRGNEA